MMMMKAATLYDAGKPCGAEANAAKYLAGEFGFEACTRAVMAHGGFGYAREYHVERFLREALIPRIAPISPELILCYISERVLGLRSEEHTSELQSLMRISSAVFSLKKKHSNQ